MSQLSELFVASWREYGLGKIPATEHRFHPVRKFRFDFAWPDCRVAVELDGFGGRHQTTWGFSKDHEKLNLAAAWDWVVLRYTARHLGSKAKKKQVCEQIIQVINMRAKRYDILARRLQGLPTPQDSDGNCGVPWPDSCYCPVCGRGTRTD